MSLVPAFEVGVWNAWIFMLLELLTFPLFFRVATDRAPKEESHDLAKLPWAKKRVLYASKIIYIPASIYSVFLPLRLGTPWFYVGFPITVMGFIASTVVILNWAASPPGRPVTNGLYRYSRHPMYATAFVFFLGVSAATASWVFLVFTILLIGSSFYFATLEEEACLAEYGDTYRKYLDRTPKYLGIPSPRPKSD